MTAASDTSDSTVPGAGAGASTPGAATPGASTRGASKPGASPPGTAAPRFKPGDRVVVRTNSPDGHVRTPGYLKGKRGTVVRDFGRWRNPEQLAYGKPGWPLKVNYWVAFTMDEVWGGSGTYASGDRIVAEIYEHWLEPADGTPASGEKDATP